jgi:formate hydrogenlyase subunit 3/multisubunit Na+/H+ antiporter MnhD subunit
MDRIERDPAAGAALGALSAGKKKKLMAAIGAALLIAGIVGMLVIGAGAINTLTTGGFSDPGEGKSIQLTEYVFLFTLLAGLVVMLYSLVGLQRDKAEARELQRFDLKSENDANAA